MIVADGLRVAFGDRLALSDVSLRVAAGELVGVVGVAAAGKTTLLKSLCLLVRPDAGKVWLAPRAPSPAPGAPEPRPSASADTNHHRWERIGFSARSRARLRAEAPGAAPEDGSLDLTALSSRALAQVRARFGFSFQNLALFDQLSTVENVAFALRRRGVGHEEALERAKVQLKAVGLE